MSTPSPISPATVHLTLQYIAPLAGPLPPHLLSTPLLQRHRFLALDPALPADYLAWPSNPDDQHRAISLLEALPQPLPDDVFRDLHVAYAADPGSIFAHVRITPGPFPQGLPEPEPALRLVFLWDPQTAAWKYHNIALMPFPPNTHPSLDDALRIFRSEDDFLHEQSPVTVHDDSNDINDDSYWDTYGQGDDDPDTLESPSPSAKDTQGDSEDAYWAQYATVQGSGDSTLPSPLPQKRKLTQPVLDPYHTQQDSGPTERIIISSGDLRIDVPHTELYNPLQPPSPRNLSRRLAAISGRTDSPPLLDEEESSPSTESGTASPPQQPAAATVTEEVTSPSPEFVVVDAAGSEEEAATEAEPTQALKDSIKGLYRLWKIGRPKPAAGEEEDDSAFLRIVRVAIAESS